MNRAPDINIYKKRQFSLRSRMRGLTLVELMVAIILMLLVTMATAALFLVTGQSNRTVDSSLQMDDTARFAFKIMENAIQNAGYSTMVPTDLDSTGRVNRLFTDCEANASAVPCPVLGFDNSRITNANTLTDFGARNSALAAANRSDSLALRFYGSGSGAGDDSIVTCSGQTVPAPTQVGDLGQSIFWVGADTDGEPALQCTGGAVVGANFSRSTSALVRGVEVFQVMYGLDLCRSSDADRPVANCNQAGQDGIVDRWVSASDVGDANWVNVRAIRLGMVLRGARGSSQSSDYPQDANGCGIAGRLYPLGCSFVQGVVGADPSLAFAPPNDGRMRRVYTTTLMLRNNPF